MTSFVFIQIIYIFDIANKQIILNSAELFVNIYNPHIYKEILSLKWVN